MQIDDHEEGGCPRRMHVANQPAPLDITHDVLDGGKRTFGRGIETHGQPNAGQDLVDQHQQRQHAKYIEEVEVLRRVVLRQMVLHHLRGGESVVHPAHDATLGLRLIWISH